MLRWILENFGIVARRPRHADLDRHFVVRAGLRAPTAAPPAPAATSTRADAPKDAWEGWYDWQSANDLPVKVEAEITYMDAEGRITERRITTRRFGTDGESGDVTILARCHLRNQNRTFKVSRIRDFVDVSTGEIISDIPAFLQAAYDETPAGQTARLLRRVADQLTILVYIARADERLTAREKAILINFLRDAGPGVDLDMANVEAAIRKAPSQAALNRALRSMAADGQTEAVVANVDLLAAARSKMDDFTAAAVSLVRKRLAKSAVSTHQPLAG